MNGDGVQLISGVAFDYDGDGAEEIGGWASAADAFLALDRNSNGIVDGASEISFRGDLAGATSDLEGLRAFDTDRDGQLSEADDAFGVFRLWRDLDADGESDLGELVSLSDAGIVSISLTRTGVASSQSDGDILGHATVTFADGSTALAADTMLHYAERSGDKKPMPIDVREVLEEVGFALQSQAEPASLHQRSFDPEYAMISPDSDQPLVSMLRQRASFVDGDHFVFQATKSLSLGVGIDPVAASDLRPQPFDLQLLEDASFDFSGAGSATPSGAVSGGGGQPSDFGWMDIADRSMADLHGALPAFDGQATDMLDYRTPDLFQDGAQLSLDGMMALGPDAFRIS
jgi:hypothetical protein